VEPSKEQLAIINEEKNCVVIAKPGSGKTFTLARKIKKILPQLPDYKGVIAISYTNKASDELKNRSLEDGLDIKGSFFGTIDKFYISEIILPFSNHIFGKPQKEIDIYSSKDPEFGGNGDAKRVEYLLNLGYKNLENKHINWISKTFLEGKVFLDLVGLMAIYVFDHSLSCRNYLKARYSHIIIDEYQDAGQEQHDMFIKIKSLGICAVAVGDGDQSIFGFANRDSRFLLELAKNQSNDFEVYSLSKNHRCHSSIINYSSSFISPTANLLPVDDIKVYEKKVIGTQVEIALWIDEYLPRVLKKLGIEDNNRAVILVRGNVTGNIIDSQLKTNHKYFRNTPLDNDSNLWSQLFKDLLGVLLDNNLNKFDMLQKYLDINLEKKNAKFILEQLQVLSAKLKSKPYSIANYEQHLIQIANVLIPNGENEKSKKLLNEVLNNIEHINSYIPAKKDEIQIMTLHKSKGLEFDIVFHLDLYNYILPNPRNDKTQDINLHYVGVTRAKKGLFLIWSTERFNASGERKMGIQSDFLAKGYLRKLRRWLP
jgi:superfamily I DNA/RNA helicase